MPASIPDSRLPTPGSSPSITFIGGGNMARSLVGGMLARGHQRDRLLVAEPNPAAREALEREFAINTTDDNAAAAAGADLLLLAVKPQVMAAVCQPLAEVLPRRAVAVSIAAGITSAQLDGWLGGGRAVIRAMPNTPARIAEGVTALSAGHNVGDRAMELATAVLGSVGRTLVLDERLLDAVTAVSGTGPAYVFLLAEALVDAAIREGLPAYAAEMLVEQTVRGAGMLLSSVDLTPERLRAQVTSPGGTTAAAVHLLEERGFRALVEDAVRAAALRSREMGERVSEQGAGEA
jgi:pyrroline-5-carboxylate reductase